MRNKNLFDKITDDKSIIEKTYSSHYEYDKTLDFGMSNKTNKLENINLIAITAMTKFLDESLEEVEYLRDVLCRLAYVLLRHLLGLVRQVDRVHQNCPPYQSQCHRVLVILHQNQIY